MASNSLITQEKLQSDFEDFYSQKIYPYLNGATHTGCVPLGTILPYFGETAPTHFLICDGTEYAKADYPELVEHLLALTDPTPYAGSDANHFKVPDLRGEFLRGTGTNSHTDQGNGANVGVHQDGTKIPYFQLENYTTPKMSFLALDSNHQTSYISNSDKNLKGDTTRIDITGSSGTTPDPYNIQSYTSRPTNTSVTYIIAYRNAYIDLALDSFPIDISNPTDGQLLMYDATAGRWVNGGGVMHEYSTNEHVVGTWIDGKPIYEKTIFCGALPNSSQKNVNHNIINLDRIVSINAIGKNPASLGQVPLPYVQSEVFDSIFFTDSQIVLISATNRSAVTETYVTIQYTKTTD